MTIDTDTFAAITGRLDALEARQDGTLARVDAFLASLRRAGEGLARRRYRAPSCRNLWPELFRCVRETQPRAIIARRLVPPQRGLGVRGRGHLPVLQAQIAPERHHEHPMANLIDPLDEGGQLLLTVSGGEGVRKGVGDLIFHVMAAVAEFERDLIAERTRDGLAAARARGRKGGRKAKLNAAQLALARQLYDGKQHTVEQIGTMFGVSRQTIYRHLAPTVR